MDETMLIAFAQKLRMELGLYWMYTNEDAKNWAKNYLIKNPIKDNDLILEKEITQEDFIDLIEYPKGLSRINIENSGKQCFELAQTYHKQKLSKLLKEAGKGLPTKEQYENKINCNDFHESKNRDAKYGARAMLEWMHENASLVIAFKEEERRKSEEALDYCHKRPAAAYSELNK